MRNNEFNPSSSVLSAMISYRLVRQLKCYGMSIQTADFEDISSTVMVELLEFLSDHENPPMPLIRGVIKQRVKARLVDWINADRMLRLFDEPLENSPQLQETELPPWIAMQLSGDCKLWKVACVLSCGAHGEVAAGMLGVNVRTLQRRKAELRERLALFAPN